MNTKYKDTNWTVNFVSPPLHYDDSEFLLVQEKLDSDGDS